MHNNNHIINIKRTCIIVFCIITIRLSYLQIYAHKQYLKKSKKNFIRYEKVPALRGSIRDCNGILIATNQPVTHIYWKPSGNTMLTAQQEESLLFLQNILQKNFSFAEYQRITQAERKKKPYPIALDVPIEQVCTLSEQLFYHPNITIKTTAKRLYPFENSCVHAIGYVERITNKGKSGLEKKYNKQLEGIPGIIEKTVNYRAITLHEKEISKPVTSKDLITTIDIAIQQIAEKTFQNDDTGACIILNPYDGAIKALISKPCFNPHTFLSPLSYKKWHDLQKNNPFINRACNATYPPGSLFKLITTTAALEQDIIKPHTSWLCPGYSICGNRKYWCNKKKGHGALSTVQAIAQSCNILFYEIGKKIDIDVLAQYAFSFGLGAQTGICLPEKKGLIPTRNWKLITKGERWWQGETVSVAIGQSFLLVTPIQIAQMIASIFTGYLVTPRLLLSDPIIRNRLTISPETIIFLQESMRSVVTGGTGKRINTIEDITIFAKTSTAQVSTLKKSSVNPKYCEHGWFVSYFQYKNNQPLVLVLLVEHAGSSSIPTTMAKNFLVAYKQLIDSKESF